MAATLASVLNEAPKPKRWFEVTWPFYLFTRGVGRRKRLRPAGHSAWVEALHQPTLVFVSLAFTAAGLYSLSIDYLIKAAAAISSGNYGQIIPVVLALFVIVVTGGAIEIAFLTAASRLRMHLLRSEWGWASVAGIMLLFTMLVELLSCSRMFYLIEKPALSAGLNSFMMNVPIILFFVRAGAALICAAYLIIGVLPFVIRPDDVRREMAAESGAAKVAIIQRLLHVIDDLTVWQMLAIYEPVAAIFRDNAGYTSAQMTNKIVLDTVAGLKRDLAAKAQQPGIDAAKLGTAMAEVFGAVEQKFNSKGVGDEEMYDIETHRALTLLQERLQDNEHVNEQVTEATQLASGFLSQQIEGVHQDLKLLFQDQFDDVHDELARFMTEMRGQSQDNDGNVIRLETHRENDGGNDSAHAQPKLSTKAGRNLLRKTVRTMREHEQSITVYAVAQALNVTREDLIAAIQAMMKEAQGRLSLPGQKITDQTLLDLGMLIEPATTTS